MKRFILICFLIFGLVKPVSAISLIGSGISGGGATCSVATNEVGNRVIGADSTALGGDILRCNLQTPDCSGKLYTAYVYAVYSGDNVKVCVYTDDGDSDPDAGDTLLVCSGEITSNDTTEWFNGALGSNPSVSTGTNYWVCLISDSTNWSTKKVPEEPGQKYLSLPGSYASPPSDLTGSWGTNAERNQSAYITIGD